MTVRRRSVGVGLVGSTEEEEETLDDFEQQTTIYPQMQLLRTFIARINVRNVCSSRFWQHHSFLIGSILAVIACIIDLVDTLKEGEDIDNAAADDDDDDGPRKLPLQYWDISKSLSVASTLLYLIDSILHFTQQQPDDNDVQTDPSVVVNYRTRMRFVITFGVAASFDLASCVTDDEDYPWPSYMFECAAVYLFWSSAVLLLYTKRAVYCSGTNCKGSPVSFWLLCFGDWLYWLGCTADVAVNIVDNPRHDVNYLWVAIIGMISAIFWFLDAVMYLLADADVFDVVVPAGHIDIDSGIIPLSQDDEVVDGIGVGENIPQLQ